jgi:hypothetical protein
MLNVHCTHNAQLKIGVQPSVSEKHEEIVAMKPGMFGVSVDIRRLLTRLARWWLARNGK